MEYTKDINRVLLFIVVCCLFLGAAGRSPAQIKQSSNITVKSASELDYPPFSIVRADGNADGFSVELLRAVIAEMGREVSFAVGPWAKLNPAWVSARAPDYSMPWVNKRFVEEFGESAGRPCYEVMYGRSQPCSRCPTFEVLETKNTRQ